MKSALSEEQKKSSSLNQQLERETKVKNRLNVLYQKIESDYEKMIEEKNTDENVKLEIIEKFNKKVEYQQAKIDETKMNL